MRELSINNTKEELDEMSMNEAAQFIGIGTKTLRERTEDGLIRAIPVLRSNAINGITYKYKKSWILEDQANMATTRIEQPVIHINIKESIQRMFL